MQRRAPALAAEVHIDREERLARALERLPLSNQRLAAVAPRLGGWLDSARVVRQRRPVGVLIIRNDLSLVVRSALVGVVELDSVMASRSFGMSLQGAWPAMVSFEPKKTNAMLDRSRKSHGEWCVGGDWVGTERRREEELGVPRVALTSIKSVSLYKGKECTGDGE